VKSGENFSIKTAGKSSADAVGLLAALLAGLGCPWDAHGFGDLAAADFTGRDQHLLNPTIFNDPDLLQVRQPTPLCFVVGMADRVAGARFLAAYMTFPHLKITSLILCAPRRKHKKVHDRPYPRQGQNGPADFFAACFLHDGFWL
jgi:hypothetical protein